jgi:hypothetical protein
MARLRVMKKEATLLAENNGHALFLWRKRPERRGRFVEAVPDSFETVCARCGEDFSLACPCSPRSPHVAGPINQTCTVKGGAR